MLCICLVTLSCTCYTYEAQNMFIYLSIYNTVYNLHRYHSPFTYLCRYERLVSVMLLHWYMYIHVYTAKHILQIFMHPLCCILFIFFVCCRHFPCFNADFRNNIEKKLDHNYSVIPYSCEILLWHSLYERIFHPLPIYCSRGFIFGLWSANPSVGNHKLSKMYIHVHVISGRRWGSVDSHTKICTWKYCSYS